MSMPGRATTYMSLSMRPDILKFLNDTFTSCDFRKKKHRTVHMPRNCPITVAMAAPATPIAGHPKYPNIMIGSSMMFAMHPIIFDIIGMIMFPVA